MTKFQKLSLFLLRISVGWMMFYAGVTKVLDPAWSAAGYLQGTKTFPAFFHWFLKPGILPLTNLVNEWGLTVLGASLILGLFVRWSSVGGLALMLLYYFPVLDFPHVAHSYIVDEHIIYTFVLLFFTAVNAGKAWGLDGKIFKSRTSALEPRRLKS